MTKLRCFEQVNDVLVAIGYEALPVKYLRRVKVGVWRSLADYARYFPKKLPNVLDTVLNVGLK